MAQTINLCAQIPIDLHSRVYADKESTGLTTSEYITRLLYSRAIKFAEAAEIFQKDML